MGTSELDENCLTLRKSRTSRSEITFLPRHDPLFKMVESNFDAGWKHPQKPKPPIRAIFEVRMPQQTLDEFVSYRTRIAESLAFRRHNDQTIEKVLFHGTNRNCLLGENKDRTRLCGLPTCFLCGIVDTSFDVEKCGQKNKFRRFGTGIYTTSCSSKADDYVVNGSLKATYRVMLANSVVVGRPYRRLKNGTKLTKPPPGYHSIIGEPGIDLNYPETVVYSNDAIRPAFLVVYGFPPEKPKTNKLQNMVLKLFKIPLAS